MKSDFALILGLFKTVWIEFANHTMIQNTEIDLLFKVFITLNMIVLVVTISVVHTVSRLYMLREIIHKNFRG